VERAARLLRDKGRLVVVGDVGLDLPRGPFYRKEIDFSLSRSYGPGRYDPVYEEGGVDYPVGYVRWTEGRNLDAVLECLARREVDVAPLITETVKVADAPAAYERILAGGGLGTVLEYGEDAAPARTVSLGSLPAAKDTAGVLLAGAGWFARTHHLPNLDRTAGLRLAGVVSGSGANARQTAEKYGAAFAGTDWDEAVTRDEVDAVLLCTRHHLHVPQAVAAIRAGKHVLVEKPLALDLAGLEALAAALAENPVRLAVGFNRRHAPLARRLRDLLAGRTGPLHGVYRMNAGRLPKEHWTNDPVEGGGRILGEGCHVFDWFRWLTGSEAVTVEAVRVASPDEAVIDADNLTATARFADGSVLTLLYTTAGPKEHPKERFEVFAPGFAAELTDYRSLAWNGGSETLRAEDKGQTAEMAAWAEYLAGRGDDVADFASAARSTWLTLRALEAAETGTVLAVDEALPAALR
jgi:predicted dehydrogenase